MPPKKAANEGSASTRKRRSVSEKSSEFADMVKAAESDCPMQEVEGNAKVKEEPGNSGPVLDAKAMNSFHSFLQKCKASPNPQRRQWYASYKSCESVEKKREWMSKWRLDKSCGFCRTAELTSTSATTTNCYSEGWYTKFEVAKELGIPVDGPEMEALIKDCEQQPHEMECFKDSHTCRTCISHVFRHWYVLNVCSSK